jgi:hypothetical protein
MQPVGVDEPRGDRKIAPGRERERGRDPGIPVVGVVLHEHESPAVPQVATDEPQHGEFIADEVQRVGHNHAVDR